MRIQEAMGMGVPAGTAMALAGSSNDNVTAAGTTTADATVLAACNNLILTGAGSTGVRLPDGCNIGDTFHIGNGTANTIIVYPPTGEEVNNTTSKNLITLTGGVFTKVGPLHWIGTGAT